MKQPTRTDSEYLEHLNFLGAIFYVSFGLVLALMAFWSIYPKLDCYWDSPVAAWADGVLALRLHCLEESVGLAF